jgi:ATP/maltotriose-dependent transcriptional regulator MalT
MFAQMGAEAFADRARRSLLAVGEAVYEPQVGAHEPLTGREEQVAALARGGLSNVDIGQRLFLSARTVEWHLSRVFSKPGIRSREELAEVLQG